MSHTYDDELSIRNTVNKFANSFDLKAWEIMQSCLTESVDVDYSDLRRTLPETISNAQFVESRHKALNTLLTQHFLGNHEIYIENDHALVNVSAVIFRSNNAGEIFDTHCLYRFKLIKALDQWRICSIVQKVLWNNGDSAIHSGIAKMDHDK